MDTMMKNMQGQMRDMGKAMREQAMVEAKKRKEDYLGTRVPKALKAEIIRQAEAQGVSVSDLMRQIIEQYCQSSDKAGCAASSPVAVTPPRPQFRNILAWEQADLNQPVNCASCQTFLQDGSRIWLGIAGQGGPVVLCPVCKQGLG